MALTDLLTNSLNYYDDVDGAWRLFIIDHKQYLINRSTTYIISQSYFQGYIYDMKRYLRSINYPTNCSWIVGLINNIHNDIMFTPEINILLIPSPTILEMLYVTYKTNSVIAS